MKSFDKKGFAVTQNKSACWLSGKGLASKAKCYPHILRLEKNLKKTLLKIISKAVNVKHYVLSASHNRKSVMYELN